MPTTPPLSLLNRAWTTPPALLTGQSQVSEHFKTPVTSLQSGQVKGGLGESVDTPCFILSNASLITDRIHCKNVHDFYSFCNVKYIIGAAVCCCMHYEVGPSDSFGSV